ncbi:hypothetical protein ACP70R_007876 [Stipagrostis hirtigluma subsp. patula]
MQEKDCLLRRGQRRVQSQSPMERELADPDLESADLGADIVKGCLFPGVGALRAHFAAMRDVM